MPQKNKIKFFLNITLTNVNIMHRNLHGLELESRTTCAITLFGSMNLKGQSRNRFCPFVYWRVQSRWYAAPPDKRMNVVMTRIQVPCPPLVGNN